RRVLFRSGKRVFIHMAGSEEIPLAFAGKGLIRHLYGSDSVSFIEFRKNRGGIATGQGMRDGGPGAIGRAIRTIYPMPVIAIGPLTVFLLVIRKTRHLFY